MCHKKEWLQTFVITTMTSQIHPRTCNTKMINTMQSNRQSDGVSVREVRYRRCIISTHSCAQI